MKLTKMGLVFALLLVSGVSNATEYVYRDLMANTIPATSCASENEAKENASKPYTVDRFSKRFCQLQGYGWHIETIKDTGKLVCSDCKTGASDKKQCHLEDVVVTCKRIKPGSVGMLPGKS
jgi:hypothetical protein